LPEREDRPVESLYSSVVNQLYVLNVHPYHSLS